MTALEPRVLRAGPAVALRVTPRAVAVCLVLGAAAVGAAALGLSIGQFGVPLDRVLPAVFGSGARSDVFFVQQQRLPRVALGLLVGACMAISGALFQSVSANALGSPDVIGFTTGSATGAVFVVTVLDGDLAMVSTGAVIGGFGTALVVYLLAVRRGMSGYRLVLVGIGVGALLASLNGYLLVRAKTVDVQSVTLWLVGNLRYGTPTHVVILLVLLVLTLPLVLVVGRDLAIAEMGDELAVGVGVRARRARIAALVLGTVLVAACTAAAGPIGFVALVAPHIARGLTRGTGLNVVASALTGATLLVIADVTATRLFAPTLLPVGIVTIVLGGTYLGVLLYRQWGAGTI